MSDRVLLFDLDGTLYPSTVGTEREIIPAIIHEVGSQLQLSPADATRLVHALNRQYGYCVRGLAAEHGLDPSVLVDRIYSHVDRSKILDNARLSAALAAFSAKGPVAVLTNSSRGHANDVLRRLGVPPGTATVLGIEEIDYHLKPANESFLIAASKLECDPSQFIYFDDSIRNLHAAWQMGAECILVGNGMVEPPMFWENHLRVAHLAPDHVESTHDISAFLEGWIEEGLPWL